MERIGLRAISITWLVAITGMLTACGGGGSGGSEDTAASVAQEEAEDLRFESLGGSLPLTLPDHGPNAVQLWGDIANATYNSPNVGAATTANEQRPLWPMDLATVHLAMYDAAMAVARTHRPYAFRPLEATDGASIDAAVGAAARSVLAALFPSRSGVYQPRYDDWLATLPDDAARAQGISLGEQAAAAVLALRRDDGRSVVLPAFVPGMLPGDFRGLNPVTPWFPYVKPLVIREAAQFRPDGPWPLTGRRYAREWQEVRDLGGTTSALRTAEQTEVARSHTELPNTFWPRNLRQFATGQPSVAENARVMAMIWTGMADSLLGCFEAKYHYLSWRPASAINLADTDGNDATVADPLWTPLGPVPNHPEYPAAHACIAGTLSQSLPEAFGTRRLSFAFTSTVTGSTHHYASVDAMADELQVSRIWGGMHFRHSLEDGATMGRKTTRFILRQGFGRCEAGRGPRRAPEGTKCKPWSGSGDTWR
jgi:hypothetical protein